MPVDPQLEAAIRERLSRSEFVRWFGLSLARVGDGESEIHLDLAPHHLNPGGIAHGGVIATIVDAAIGLALRTRLGRERQHVTVNLSVQYLSPVSDGTVVARGRAVHSGERTGYGEAEIRSADGRLLARGSATFLSV